MIEYDIKEAVLESSEDILAYAAQLKAASSKLVGSKSVKKLNTAEYLDCKDILTDRNKILILNQDINVEGRILADMITEMPQDDLEKFMYEKPVYQNIYAGLMARLLSAKYFHKDNWQSRKIVHSNSVECISFVKMFVENDELYLIAFIRSSSNRLLNVDFLGLIFVALDLIDSWEIEINKGEIVRQNMTRRINTVHLSMQVTDYHHIKEENNVNKRPEKKS